MARFIHRLGLLATLSTLVAACGDSGTTSNSTGTTEGGGGRGGDTVTGDIGGGGAGGTNTGGSSTGGSNTGGTNTGGSNTGGTNTGGTATGGGGTGGTNTGGTNTGGTATGGGGAGGMTTGSGGMTTGSGGMGGTGGMGQGGMGGTGGSNEIATVRAAMDGSGLELPVTGVFVTYTKPELGLDLAGFFVQGEAAGPAIFVAIDPASLSPVPKVGDKLDFVVNAVSTSSGIKEVTAITNAVVVDSNNPIDPLVTEVTTAMDLVSNLDAYESRVIRVTGDLGAFVSAGTPQVAAKLTTAGLDDANLRLRMPEMVRAQYDLKAGCSATVDYGVMWRFNAVAQPSVYSAEGLTGLSCPAPTVVSAIALSNTEVVVSFDRKLDPATVDAADFTFDQGLAATAVSVNGSDVTVTTTPDVPGLTYTVTAANLTDVLGAPIGMPNTAMFQSYTAVAQLQLNEINSNITGAKDLIEILVTSGGSVSGITLVQRGTVNEVLATFPDVNVATGDLIVVHLTPATAAGAAPGSELLAKNQYLNAAFGANYDGAWDFHGGIVGLSFSHRVIALVAPGNVLLDAVPFVVSNSGSPPAAFPSVLQALQAAGLWLPVDCGGALCTYASTPTAVAISVDYLGAGNSPTGNSVARKPGLNTKQKSDWNVAGPQSFGLPNP